MRNIRAFASEHSRGRWAVCLAALAVLVLGPGILARQQSDRGGDIDAGAGELGSKVRAVRGSQFQEREQAGQTQSSSREVGYDEYLKVTAPEGWMREYSWELAPRGLLWFYDRKVEEAAFVKGEGNSEFKSWGIKEIAGGNNLTLMLSMIPWPGPAARFGSLVAGGGGFSIRPQAGAVTVTPMGSVARIRYLGKLKVGPRELELIEWLSEASLDESLTKKLGLPPRFEGQRVQILYGETAFGSVGPSYRMVAARFTRSPGDVQWIEPLVAGIGPIPDSEKDRASREVRVRKLIEAVESNENSGDYPDALDQLRPTLKLFPEDTNVLTLEASVLVRQHHEGDAIPILSRVAASDPDNEFAHLFLGFALWNLGKKQEALREFEAAHSIDPLLPPTDELLRRFSASEHQNTQKGSGTPGERAAAPEPARHNLTRVDGDAQMVKLIQRVDPVYPPAARAAGVEGDVVLQAIISKEGLIQKLKYISGFGVLVQAAMDAVRQWRYRPTFVNGEPVEVETTVTVRFRLGG